VETFRVVRLGDVDASSFRYYAPAAPYPQEYFLVLISVTGSAATRTTVRLGSIPGATRFSEQQWVWNGVYSALVRINEELLEGKVAAPV
jgi:hypothetical protein